MTPYLMIAITLQYSWQPNFLDARSSGPIWFAICSTNTCGQEEMKEPERRLNIAKFIFRWDGMTSPKRGQLHAQGYADQQKAASPFLEAIKDARA
jgi:hypothetical protein